MNRPIRFSLAWFAIAGMIFTIVIIVLTLIHPIFHILSFVPVVLAVLLSLPGHPLVSFFNGKSIFQNAHEIAETPRPLAFLYLTASFVSVVLFVSLFFTRQFSMQCVASSALPMFAWDLMISWRRSLRTEYNQFF